MCVILSTFEQNRIAMYLAEKRQSTNVPLYIPIFERLSAGKDLEQKTEINDVLKLAKKISIGQKEIFEAPNNYFYLITFLLTHGRSFLSEFDDKAISTVTYSRVRDILKKAV